MTEYTKRYEYDYEDPTGPKIIDKKTGKHFKLETIGDFQLLTDIMSELSFERKCYMSDANQFEKECKRLYNNLRLTKGDLKYEEIMHKNLKKENNQLKQFFNKCEDEMQYYRSKSASLEEGYIAYQNENEKLKQILREVEHELISITGLSAFDKCASHLGYVEVFDEDMIELDYSKLLKRIEKVIK